MAELARDPERSFDIPEPHTPAVGLETYRIRERRWKDGEGPRLRGISRFIREVEAMETPGAAIGVDGESLYFVAVLNADLSAFMAVTAVEKEQES